MVLTFSRETEARCEWLADTMRRAQRRLGFHRLEQMAGEMGMDRTTAYRRLRRCREAVREATENHFFFDGRCNKPAPIAEILYEEDNEND